MISLPSEYILRNLKKSPLYPSLTRGVVLAGRRRPQPVRIPEFPTEDAVQVEDRAGIGQDLARRPEGGVPARRGHIDAGRKVL